MAGGTGGCAALPLAERLRAASSSPAVPAEARITCSIGLVTFARAPDDTEELLTRADALMYQAKASGGDGVRHARVGSARSTATNGRLLRFARRSMT
ncbi:MAG: diguanylate cyclase [Actinobacteria bacterium]|nr:diguanylate cyclase [Actinomycetota bacterium]